MLRIYADFNNVDEQGCIQLNTAGSLKDLETHRDLLREGMKVVLYMADEFEVHGTLVFDGIWLGIPDWNTTQYANPKDSPK